MVAPVLVAVVTVAWPGPKLSVVVRTKWTACARHLRRHVAEERAQKKALELKCSPKWVTDTASCNEMNGVSFDKRMIQISSPVAQGARGLVWGLEALSKLCSCGASYFAVRRLRSERRAQQGLKYTCEPPPTLETPCCLEDRGNRQPFCTIVSHNLCDGT